MKKQFQIRIYPDGKIEAKTLGIKGAKCTDQIQILEQLLEARALEHSFTAEYYESEVFETNEQELKSGI